jgi:hypothetical protein
MSTRNMPTDSDPETWEQAVAIQRIVYEVAMKPEVTPLERARLVSAWCKVEQCKRKLRPNGLFGDWSLH